MKSIRSLLSILWIFITVNYIFCDVLSLFYSDTLKQLLTGEVDGIKFTQEFLLIFSIIMEIPMLMIVLSKILAHKINKIFNIVSALIMLIVQVGSLVTGENLLHYIFFSSIEIITLLIIIYLAWRWNENVLKV